MLKSVETKGMSLILRTLFIVCVLPSLVFGQGGTTDEFKSYDLNKNHRKVKLTDLIQEVEFIRLEETAESLLGNVQDVHIVGDKFVFMGDTFKGNIFVFDNQGKLINRINNKGNGPGQYSWLTDLWIEGDLIAIFDCFQKAIKKYQVNGDYVSERKFDYAASHVIGKGNDYFLDMNYEVIDDQSRDNLFRLDQEMNVKSRYFPFEGNEKGLLTNYPSFFNYKQSIIYSQPSSDIVYLYKEDKFVPFVQFDFGDDWHWDDNSPRGPDIIKSLRAGEKVWKATSRIGTRYISVSSLYGKSGRERLEHVIDRVSSEVILIDLGRSSKEGFFDLQISHWESDDTFYAFLPSLDAVGLVTEASRKNWSFRGGTSLEEIASSENSVLVRIKIKDFSKD